MFVIRLIALEVTPRPEVQCETVAWRLVGLLGAEQGAGLRARTSKLAAVIAQYRPDARVTIDDRRRQLDTAVQGKGLFLLYLLSLVEEAGIILTSFSAPLFYFFLF